MVSTKSLLCNTSLSPNNWDTSSTRNADATTVASTAPDADRFLRTRHSLSAAALSGLYRAVSGSGSTCVSRRTSWSFRAWSPRLEQAQFWTRGATGNCLSERSSASAPRGITSTPVEHASQATRLSRSSSANRRASSTSVKRSSSESRSANSASLAPRPHLLRQRRSRTRLGTVARRSLRRRRLAFLLRRPSSDGPRHDLFFEFTEVDANK